MGSEMYSSTRWCAIHSVRNVFSSCNDAPRHIMNQRITVKWKHLRKVGGKRNSCGNSRSQKKQCCYFLNLSVPSQDFRYWGNSHICIKLQFFLKNVSTCQHAENTKSTLKAFFHFAVASANYFLLETLPVFLPLPHKVCRAQHSTASRWLGTGHVT